MNTTILSTCIILFLSLVSLGFLCTGIYVMATQQGLLGPLISFGLAVIAWGIMLPPYEDNIPDWYVSTATWYRYIVVGFGVSSMLVFVCIVRQGVDW